MLGRGWRCVLTTTALGATLVLGACGSGGSDAPAGATTSSPTKPPLTAGEPSESELSPGWDESPDGPAPTPDADLPDAALTALLRTRSSATDGEEACGPADVTAELSGVDVALGHRYTSLVVTNTSSRTCVVEGCPVSVPAASGATASP